MTDYYNTKKKIAIVEEIKRWITDVLSVPSKHFNGIPPCPYAKLAWLNNKVKVDFGGRKKIDQYIYDWPYETDVVIVVIDQPWDFDDIEAWCDESNKQLVGDDLVLIPFVPGSEIDTGQPEEEQTNWEPVVEEEYAMVFIQCLSELEKASAHLMSKGYYKNCSSQFMEYVTKRAERYGNARIQEDHEEEEEADDDEQVWID